MPLAIGIDMIQRRKEALQHCADVPGGVAEIGHFPIGDTEVETIARWKHQHIVPLHVAMNETVETPLGAERVEQSLEVFVLLQERRDRRPDAVRNGQASRGRRGSSVRITGVWR